MNSDDFRQMGRSLLGKGWQTRLAEMLGVDGSTIRRWVATGATVPSTAFSYLRMMADRQETRGALVFARQGRLLPVDVEIDQGPLEYEKLAKTIRFPGVQDAKRLPSIHVREQDGRAVIQLKDEAQDEIEIASLSYLLTRHPDPWHLDGYRQAALSAAHAVAVTQYGDHFYTLIAHRSEQPPLILHHIATHAAVNRRIWSPSSSPSAYFHQDLG